MKIFIPILISLVIASCSSNNSWTCEGDCENGEGTKIWPDGSFDKGIWKDGELTGEGEKKFGPNSVFSGDTYHGSFKDGKYQGFGTYYDSDEDITYKGEWQNGKSHGKGKTTSGPNSKHPGEFYDGEWKNGEKHGYGIWYLGGVGKDFFDQRYEGEWINGDREGHGKYYWEDKSYYEGSFAKDEKHGKGKIHYPSGEVFEGVWDDGYCQELAIKLGLE